MSSELTFPPKKVLPVYFVLDTSGGMYGAPIWILNDAMDGVVQRLINTEAEIDHVSIRIGVLEFNTFPKWLTAGAGQAEAIESFDWIPLSANGLTSTGAALLTLDQALTELRKSMQSSAERFYRPVVVFFTDGMPVDDWKTALLSSLFNNTLYRKAVKAAVALGDADIKLLKAIVFADDDGRTWHESPIVPGSVIYTDDPEQLSGILMTQTILGVNQSVASDRIWPEDLKEQEQHENGQDIQDWS